MEDSKVHHSIVAQLAYKEQIKADPELARLNFGIFALHLVQMAMFVVLPHALVDHGGLHGGGIFGQISGG